MTTAVLTTREQLEMSDDVRVAGDIIEGMVRTIIQLPEEQAAALDRAARRRGVSKASVVREALAALLGPEQIGEDEALARALAAAGSFGSGVPDLAERHDHYLTQA
jgi:hypothetical protein